MARYTEQPGHIRGSGMKFPKKLRSGRASRASGSMLFLAAIGAMVMPQAASAQVRPSAAVRLNQLGSENQNMVSRVGLWDMTETRWNSPGTAPVSTTGLVAERRMIGSYLQEILRPASDVTAKAIKRIDYLSFDRVKGQWEYVSMDTRAPVGVMPGQSYTRGNAAGIDLIFAPLVIAGNGANVEGQMMRMEQVITRQGPDRDMKEQYFIMADGTGTRWLAHRYVYARRRS